MCFIVIFVVVSGVRKGKPAHGELERLAQDIGSYWKKLGRRLEIDDSRLVAFERENQELSEQASKMLQHWKQSNASATTYKVLDKALIDERVCRRDLAEKYCQKKK